MMTLESSSPVQQPWELLTAQTAHPLQTLKPTPHQWKDVS